MFGFLKRPKKMDPALVMAQEIFDRHQAALRYAITVIQDFERRDGVVSDVVPKITAILAGEEIGQIAGTVRAPLDLFRTRPDMQLFRPARESQHGRG